MNSGMIYAVTAIVCMLQILLIINRTGATKYKETIDNSFRRMLWFFALLMHYGACVNHIQLFVLRRFLLLLHMDIIFAQEYLPAYGSIMPFVMSRAWTWRRKYCEASAA